MKKSRMSGRVDVFVTAGKPTKKALEPSGVGLELAPVTHPNALVSWRVAGRAGRVRAVTATLEVLPQ